MSDGGSDLRAPARLLFWGDSMKRIGWLLVAAALLCALSACNMILAVPLEISPPTQTAPIDEAVGYATAYWVVEGNGTATVDYGDGASETLALEPEQTLHLEHTYSYIGLYRVTFTQGSTVVETLVSVTCIMPVVASFHYTSRVQPDLQKITYNAQWREHGCDNGVPHAYSGIQPGSGTTEFRLTAYYDGEKLGIFDEAGTNVCGEWVLLADDVHDGQSLFYWVGWTGENTMTPMAAEKGCGDDEPGDWTEPGIPEDAEHITFTLTVRNEYMRETGYMIETWVVWFQPHQCSVVAFPVADVVG